MRILAFVALLCSLLAFAPPARAQFASGPIIERFEFPGGTLGELVTALKAEIDPVPLNVVLKREAGALPVTSMSFRNVTLSTVMELAAPRTDSYSTIDPETGAITDHVRRFQMVGGGAGAPVFIIDAHSTESHNNMRSRGDQRPRQHRVFSLANIGSAEIALDAIDAALGLNDADPAEVRYHKDSGLLIVLGTPDQLSLTSEIVEQLGEDTHRAAGEDEQREMRIADLEHELDKAIARVEVSEQELQLTLREMEHIQQQAAQELVSDRDVSHAELRVLKMKSEIDTAKAEVAYIQKMLDQTRSNRDRADEKTEALRRRIVTLESEINRLKSDNAALRQGR